MLSKCGHCVTEVKWLSGFNEQHINFVQTGKHRARHLQTFNKSKAGASLITLMDTERDEDNVYIVHHVKDLQWWTISEWANSAQLPRKWSVLEACII